jgi:hypothetical protein
LTLPPTTPPPDSTPQPAPPRPNHPNHTRPAPCPHRETEIKQLQGWKVTVENLIERFEELILAKSVLGDVEEGGAKAAAAPDVDPFDSSITNNPSRNALIAAQHHMQLSKLRSYFHKDVRKQLYSEDDDKAFFNRIKTQVKQVGGGQHWHCCALAGLLRSTVLLDGVAIACRAAGRSTLCAPVRHAAAGLSAAPGMPACAWSCHQTSRSCSQLTTARTNLLPG